MIYGMFIKRGGSWTLVYLGCVSECIRRIDKPLVDGLPVMIRRAKMFGAKIEEVKK